MKKLFLILSLAFLPCFAFSQDLTFYGFIPSYSQTGMISRKFDYNFFASVTNNAFPMTYGGIEYPAKILQTYIQPSLIYKLRPNINLAASITYNYQRNNPNALFSKEWRPWQQIVFTHTPFQYRGRLSHRLRLEERFIKRLGDTYQMTTRLRYQMGYLIPFQGKTLDAKEFYFNAYYEIYFSLSNPKSRPRNALHSEDWIYAGIGYNTGNSGRIEIGPLYQTNVRDRLHHRRNLVLLQILWVTNFNPKRKERL